MSRNVSSSVVQHSVDRQFDERKRSSSLRWITVNSVLFLVFAYDVWQWCPGYMSVVQYVELAGAGVLLANALVHGARLSAPRRTAPATPLPHRPTAPSSDPNSDAELSVSLSPARWRTSPSPSPPTPPSPGAPVAPHLDRLVADEFIADRSNLADNPRAYEERSCVEAAGGSWAPLAGASWAPRHYQLAVLDNESTAEAEGEARAPHVWRRLQLDPRRLTQWNFNLRLWLQVTILERVVRELPPAPPVPPPLLPYTRPFADQRYVLQRIGELAASGCLSAYKWNGGGSAWDESKPTDAELVLHVLSAYLDAQLAPDSFSGAHVSAAPAPPPRGPRALAVHRVAARPPHYVLALGTETVELARGRNNLLHTLLLLLAAAAQRRPPALQRVHLGPAGLNMLWIIDR